MPYSRIAHGKAKRVSSKENEVFIRQMLTYVQIMKVREVLKVSWLNRMVIGMFERIFEKNQFAFRELLFMGIVSKMRSKFNLSECELEDMVISIRQWLPNLKNTFYRFVVCQREDQRFCLLLQQDTPLYFDHKTTELQILDLEELAKDLHLELNKVLEEGCCRSL